jgi:tagatose-6-phosphate ketose/aldose isomerase
MRSISSTDLVSAPQLYINGKSKPLPKPLVVSFGRSGNSSESVGVLNLLDQLLPQAPRLNITCNSSSELATRNHPSDQQRTIILPAHDEGFAMTASFSCMLLSAASGFDPQMSDCADALSRLSARASTLLAAAPHWAQSCKQPSRMVFLGSGCLQFAAREATLKVMELTAGRVPGLWDSPLGFRHGPKSFIDPQTHVVLFESEHSYSRLYDQDLAQEIRTQFPENALTVISNNANNEMAVEPGLPDHWNSVLYLLTAQVLAVELSQRLQLNVDDPFIGTNTLTRVVAGVRLHPWPAD